MHTQLVVASLLLAVCAAGAQAQGLYWESTTTSPSATRTAQTWTVAKKLKLVDSGGATVIIRRDLDKVLTVDPTKKTYTETSLADLERAIQSSSRQVEAAMAQMQEKMKTLPAEQREMVEKMMRGAGVGADPPDELVVRKIGETRTIGGYLCSGYEATAGGKTELVVWATNDVPGFAALRQDYRELQQRLAAATRRLAGGAARAYAKIDGFPMQIEHGGVRTLVTRVEQREIAATEFDVPAGYEKMTLLPPGAPLAPAATPVLLQPLGKP